MRAVKRNPLKCRTVHRKGETVHGNQRTDAGAAQAVHREDVGERSKKHSRTASQEIRIYYRNVEFVDSPEEDDLAEISGKDDPAA